MHKPDWQRKGESLRDAGERLHRELLSAGRDIEALRKEIAGLNDRIQNGDDQKDKAVLIEFAEACCNWGNVSCRCGDRAEAVLSVIR